ncbi:FG-GAP repeat domain-containing protein [Spirosoma montaniterrae]|uniref:VCBS repeat-containing protein n=1 Tax=Spirosoma montaniterrae TaxID=1178516 RepID=A0A1P9X089_9BACT|nr:VCBS repeat-containing protein [Spirosoma montaniterrae]AQG81044.1 hypothetical protein AWR27_17990 [Spirosoma montaniterrae]
MRTLLLFLLPVVAVAQTPEPKFSIQVVDNQINIGYGLAIGDVDGDQKPDILLADQKTFVWYKNPGRRGAPWPRFVMAENLTPQDNVCIAARDLDGDGRVEVAVGAGWDPSQTDDSTKSGAVFYLARPADPTQRWEAIRLPHEVTTHRMRWAKTGTMYQLIVVPLHGRGNRNGVGRGVRTWGYEWPKNTRGPWKRHLVDSTLHMTHNFEIWEDGSATGLIIGGKEGVVMKEWQAGNWQTADNESVSKTLKYLTGDNEGFGEIRRYDRGAGIASIQPMHGNILQTETGNYAAKRPDAARSDKEVSVLTDQMNQGHALVCGDFLGTGRDQIVVGWRNPNKEGRVGLRLYVPQEIDNVPGYVINDSVRMACEDLQAADLDGDGKLDLIASGRATLNVLIYWNER